VTETTLQPDKPKTSPLLRSIIPLVYALIVIVVFAAMAFRLQSSERELCSGVAVRAAAEMESSLGALRDEASMMALAIARQADLSKTDAARIAAVILSSRPYVTGVSLAPAALVRYHFPETEGESLIGHDLLSNPERRQALTRAMELNSAVFSGPFESLDEGDVLFIRYPVFSAGKFWGFVSITLDFDDLIKTLALDTSYPGFAFALSAVDEAGAPDQTAGLEALNDDLSIPGLMIAGDGNAFRLGVSSALLDLQGLSWRLHVMPSRGWLALSPALYLLGVAALAGAFFLFAWIKALTKRRPLEAKTEELFFPLPAEQGKKPIPPFPEVIDGPMNHPPREKPARASVQPKPEAGIEARPRAEGGPAAVERTIPEVPLADESVTSSDAVTIHFKGPSVKGQLYMPDVLFSGNPKDLFAHLRVVEENGTNSPETLLEPEAEPEPKSGKISKPDATLQPGLQPELEPEARAAPVQDSKNLPVFDVAREKAAEYRAAATLGSISILVVDDSEANRDIMGRMLSLRGYEPEFAASGEEALARCSAKEYAIIFMDCFMPGMDGYKTSELIRSSRVSSKTKIVGMSARVGAKELERCRSSGMNELLSKPFTLSQITAMIQGLAGRG